MNRALFYTTGAVAGLSAAAAVALLGYMMLASIGPCNNGGGFPWDILWPVFPLIGGYAAGAITLCRKTAKLWPHVPVWLAIGVFAWMIGDFPDFFFPLVLGLPSIGILVALRIFGRTRPASRNP